jgi:hydroxymethylpyrimidine/phosphomethylpyrimidine kinase
VGLSFGFLGVLFKVACATISIFINMNTTIPNVLTVAGSDSGGGAGIQADLKTFSALGVYGASVITALTAQNTRGVSAIHTPDASFVTAELDAVFSDIRIDAVKIGMLANVEIVRAVAAALKRYRPPYVVLDTVMISKSHHALLSPEAVVALRDELLPLANLLTPNLPEAAALLGIAVADNETAMLSQGEALRALGAQSVLMKGGHLAATEESPDWLIQPSGAQRLSGPRIPVKNTHGTGCTLSSAIAALVPQRADLANAVADAKNYLSDAIKHSTRLEVGGGIGPVHHFYRWW